MQNSLFYYITIASIFNLSVCFIDSNWICEEFQFNSNLNVDIREKILAIVNFDSCKRCLQKLVALKSLQLRFTKAGYNDLVFVALTNHQEDSVKFSQLRNTSGNVKIVSSAHFENVFQSDAIYIFDQCSRLTYELIPPLNENMIMKAAILSTLYDIPCGSCERNEVGTIHDSAEDNIELRQETDIQMNQTIDVEVSELQSYGPDIFQKWENDSSYIIPLQFVVPMEHVHIMQSKEGYIKYNFMVLKSNDNTYHGHLPHDKGIFLYNSRKYVEIKDRNLNNFTNTKVLVDNNGFSFRIVKTFVAGENNTEIYEEVVPVEEFITIQPQNNTDTATNITSKSYASLYQWLSFRLVEQN